MRVILCVFVCTVFPLAFSLDPCGDHKTCGDCIRDPARCVWCAKKSKLKENRCISENLAPVNWCQGALQNPRNQQSVQRDDEFNSDLNKTIVQIKPQAMKLQLRAGESFDFIFSYKAAENYPVDMYFLLDSSKTMVQIRGNVTKETEKLYQTMYGITKNVFLGLGVFVDKNLLPFTMKKNSVLTYSFKHLFKLSKDYKTFRKILNETEFGSNYDIPESGLDALAQVIACKKLIGWRNESRKIVILISDGSSHVAGDGKWAGLINPYDGECYTSDKNVYENEQKMDYPSLSILDKLASDADISVIFLIQGEKGTYDLIESAISGSRVIELAEKGVGISKILSHEYKKITRDIQLKVNIEPKDVTDKIELSFKPDCYDMIDNYKCKVKLGEEKTISGTIKILQYIPSDIRVEIAIQGVKEKMTLDIEVLKECSCQPEADNPCKSGAIRRCGVCECPPDKHGELCSCNSTSSSSIDADDIACKAPNSSVQCSGAGSCICGSCLCKDGYKGVYCECDNTGCPSDDRGMCGGHGDCECGLCRCHAGWSWSGDSSTSEVCNCRKSTTECQTDNNLCFDYGHCKCGRCKCSSICEWDARSSLDKYCRPESCTDTATQCHDSQCSLLKPIAFGNMNDNTCNDRVNVTTVESLDSMNLSDWQICSNVRVDVGCYTNYAYKYDNETYGISLIVQSKSNCAESYYIYGGTCLAALVAIGILTIGIWKLLTMHRDRQEYQRFIRQKASGKSVRVNPHYEAACTTYANPAYKANN